jgi:DnaA family protein
MPEQIPLFNQFQDSVNFTNFWPGENARLIELIQEQVLKADQPSVYLWGNAGVGKSHLLQAACRYAYEQRKTAVYLPLADFKNMTPEIFQGLEQYSVICIDDLQAIATESAWESELFHLYNRARENAAVMLFGANKRPAELAMSLQDLVSRLAWGIVWQMRELPDDGKLAALQWRAQQRGFSLPDEVGAYLMQRWPRDMHSLFALLDKLDHASLSEQRKLTIPFVRQFL